MYNAKCIDSLRGRRHFAREDAMRAMQSCEGSQAIGSATFNARFQRLLKDGCIARIGRNTYIVPNQHVQQYHYAYSELSNKVADLIIQEHPKLAFSVFELVQLNEFVNHQLAHNVVFISVESKLGSFVFETLREAYPGRVLINVKPDMFHQYWSSDMIVIGKLTTEAPKGIDKSWHTRLEKLLVDLIADPLLTGSISEGELPGIYEEAFKRYVIDESQMFRYAKRRTAEQRLKRYLDEKTSVKLRIAEPARPGQQNKNKRN